VIGVEGPHLAFHCYTNPPLGVEQKPVEILVGNLGLILSFKSKHGQQFKFKCHEVVNYGNLEAAA
jgi:hypothetical protein